MYGDMQLNICQFISDERKDRTWHQTKLLVYFRLYTQDLMETMETVLNQHKTRKICILIHTMSVILSGLV